MAHTPGPWRKGKTLLTDTTKRWSSKAWNANEEVERVRIYAHFSDEDQGRARQLIAKAYREEDVPLIAAAPGLLDALEKIRNLERRNFREAWDMLQEVDRLATAAIRKAEGESQ
jgi:hypothetical protein